MLTDVNGYYDQKELDKLAPTIMISRQIDEKQFDILEYHKNYSSNEKTADEMFKELGYEKTKDDENTIQYHYDENGSDLIIEFFSDKTIEKYYLPDYEPAVITAKEIKAINKKVDELQWN